MASAYAVFDGVAVSKRVTIVHQYGGFYPANEVTFAVSHVWKGNRVSRIVMLEDGSDCGRRFSVGERYLVFADGYEALRDRLTASGCSPTVEVVTPRRTLDAQSLLGTPHISFPGPAPRALSGRAGEAWYVGSGYLVAGISVARSVLARGRGVKEMYHSMTPVLALAAGAAAVLLLAIAAVLRRRRRGAVALVASAIGCAFLTLVVTGFLYARHPANWWMFAWQVPSAAPPPPPPPPAGE